MLQHTFPVRAAKALDASLAASTSSLRPSTCAAARSSMASSGCMLSASIMAFNVLRNIATCSTRGQEAPIKEVHGQSCQMCANQAAGTIRSQLSCLACGFVTPSLALMAACVHKFKLLQTQLNE